MEIEKQGKIYNAYYTHYIASYHIKSFTNWYYISVKILLQYSAKEVKMI